MRKFGSSAVAFIVAMTHPGFADQSAEKEQEASRAVAISEFAKKMRDANYPALFDSAATEFGVPVDILKGVAFAETRWDHLTWPPGETRSPENGMPRPFGIMSLWDNDFFGHSLVEAATLIGKDPEELKQDPYQNIRGGAALLRKIYDETPTPPGSRDSDIESWRDAIRKYCGIPEPDLNARHALDVYTFISQGYHGYGIDWTGRTVNLGPIIAETKSIVAQENAKREALRNTEALAQTPSNALSVTQVEPAKPRTQLPPQIAVSTPQSETTLAQRAKTWWWVALAGFIFAIAAIFVFRSGKRSE